VPADARAVFLAATAAGAAAFAILGVFTALAPSFLVGTLHQTSHAMAGAVAFAAFAAGAVAQIALSRVSTRPTLKTGVAVLLPGLALLTAGTWAPSLPLFVAGSITTGAGAGLLFRGAATAAGSTAPPQSRAEALAGYFLGSYLGLSLPAIGLGIAAQHAPTRDVMLTFAAIIALAAVATVSTVLARSRETAGHTAPAAANQEQHAVRH
jgi:MFS family permease